MLSYIISRLRRFEPIDRFVTRMDPYKSAYDWISTGVSLVMSTSVFSWIASHWHYLAEQGWAVVTLFSVACSMIVGFITSIIVIAVAAVRISKRQAVTISPTEARQAVEGSASNVIPSSVEAALALSPDPYVLRNEIEGHNSIFSNHHERIIELAGKIGGVIGTTDVLKETTKEDFAELRDELHRVKAQSDARFSKIADVLRARLRIPIQAGHPFRDEAGQRSDLMSDGVPR